jgi:hypothetical protein
MFQVTLLDHIRLSFGGVVHSYKAHSVLAQRLTQRLWQIRAAELALLAGALAAAGTAALRSDVRYVVLSAVLIGIALVVFTFYVAVNLESRIYAHRWCASRLWLIREKYRALLSEMRDGTITLETVRDRRDQLLIEIQSISEHAPPRRSPDLSERASGALGDIGKRPHRRGDRPVSAAVAPEDRARRASGQLTVFEAGAAVRGHCRDHVTNPSEQTAAADPQPGCHD